MRLSSEGIDLFAAAIQEIKNIRKLILNLENCDLAKLTLELMGVSLSKCGQLEFLRIDLSKNIKLDINVLFGEFLSLL